MSKDSRIVLSCSTLVYKLDRFPNLQDNLNAIKEMGFKAVDLAAFENWQNINPSMLLKSPDFFNATVDVIKNSGLKVTGINAGFSEKIEDPSEEAFTRYTQEFRKLLEFSNAIGCDVVTIQAGNYRDMDFDQLFERIAQRAEILGGIASEYNISLNLEGHYGSTLEKLDNAVKMMERVGRYVGFTYDPSHYIMQGLTLEDTRPLVSYTGQVHIRNAKAGRMQADMETGEIDIAEFVRLLRKENYEGSVAIEYFNGFDADLTNTLELRDKLLAEGLVLI